MSFDTTDLVITTFNISMILCFSVVAIISIGNGKVEQKNGQTIGNKWYEIEIASKPTIKVHKNKNWVSVSWDNKTVWLTCSDNGDTIYKSEIMETEE